MKQFELPDVQNKNKLVPPVLTEHTIDKTMHLIKQCLARSLPYPEFITNANQLGSE